MNDKEGLQVSAKVDSTFTKGNLIYIFVTAKLKNPSVDTLKYITMSCSWQTPFRTDVKELVIRGEDCDKNFPELKELLPSKEEQFSLQLTTNINIDTLQTKIFRVGFNWVSAENFDEMRAKLPQLWEMTSVIWSDRLRIEKLSRDK